ncbi:MAG: UDP-N-acetylmuramoyl-L-alanyl-D-glutamate--2,6-diaminopimelate ligase [Lentisphaerae bacterium]|jgi:UDP-N-acetylmuramoyl-L-alanyl-D-glutamate--2,6-diaminopimelate ligase|nr:UDP-N-acetylmuramoyl-L-alanyl-D-glutamate--2,6-diaminopimelate ligase [Lentisphaerota bacterium]
MTLHETISTIAVHTLHNCPVDIPINGLQCDSRLIQPGDIFFALPGTHDNGLRFVDHALSLGAAAIVAAAPPTHHNIPWVELATPPRPALAHLACHLNNHPSRNLDLYAITGTNGKTTTAGLTRDILTAHNITTGLFTTVITAYPGTETASPHTTPDAVTLQALLRCMVDAHCRAAVMEVSSHALDQHRCDGSHFKAVAFTNLTQDHLDYHHTMDAYFAAKTRLFTELATTDTTAVINTDDPYGARLADLTITSAIPTLTYGINGQQDIHATNLTLTSTGTTFNLVTPHGASSVNSHLPGHYNVMNMLCATALAHSAAVPLETTVATLNAARPRWGRLELVQTPHPAQLFVDYAHTDDALDNVLSALREITRNRLIVVFGCGGDRDRGKRPKMAVAAARHADLVIVTSDNPRSESPSAIINEIVIGFPSATLYHTIPDRRDAIALALRRASAGDVVLVAGKGHETTQTFADKTIFFDDRSVLRELTNSM